jgi:hypothetical protein
MKTVAGVLGEDPTLPEVSIILGGVERKLCFDYNAIVLAEKATGVNLLQGIVGEITASNLRGLLWAALKRDCPKLTLDELGTMIKPHMLGTIHQALQAAWFGSLVDPDKAAEAEPTGEAEAQAAPSA